MLRDKYIKSIKLLQERNLKIKAAHIEIQSEIEGLKNIIAALDIDNSMNNRNEYLDQKEQKLIEMSHNRPLKEVSIDSIYKEANLKFPQSLNLDDVLTNEDFVEIEKRTNEHIAEFNAKYGLDRWDYAIAGSCGLFASMLHLLCVAVPSKPSSVWQKDVDGVFNRQVQKAFNKILPPEFSKTLSERFPIRAPDTPTTDKLINAPKKSISPINHRLRSLAHDPILGIIFGVRDMINGTCTIVVDGRIISAPSTYGPLRDNIFQLIGRMLGHLVSDVNAPSSYGNRGMGLPAPFMGLLRMLNFIPVDESTFDRQIEWMYVKGYDFRQFMVTSIPMAIMEILLRVFYVAKQMKLYNATFGETILDTIPMRLNPRFRIILALAYGTSSAVNAGEMHITKNIMRANYASWMGLCWNGFHALRWLLYAKHARLWESLEEKEIKELKNMIGKIDSLQNRAYKLPI